MLEIRGLNKTLKQVMTGMSVSRQEEGFLQDDSQDAPQPESRTEEDVPNQTYAASGLLSMGLSTCRRTISWTM